MGLTHPQYLVMLALWGGEPLSVTELSRRLELDPATLSRLLRRLEAAGLVRRDRNPADERSLAVALTDRGRDLRTQALEVPGTILQRLGMELDELLDLRDRLTEVIGAREGGDGVDPEQRGRPPERVQTAHVRSSARPGRGRGWWA